MEKVKTRKPHKKSRNGCLPCKARHVKCDEQQPSCANCVKQATPCEYRPAKSREGSTGSPLPVTSAPTPSSAEGGVFDPNVSNAFVAPFQDPTILNLLQLRLLHHYTTVTALTLGADSGAHEVYATIVPQTAFEYPFLLHVLLALAALHLSRLSGSSQEAIEFALIGGRHHDAALANFQVTIRDIDESNFKSVLMFAGLLFPYSCASSVEHSQDVDHAFDSLLSNFTLTRRVRPMVSSFYNAMKASVLEKLIPQDVQGIDWLTQEPPEETELVQLRKFAQAVHHLYPPDIVDAYGYAVHILVLTFAAAKKSNEPPSDALLKIWLHFVSDRYVELLSERQPGSLIIYAHYAVLLRKSSVHYWYLAGVAEQILQVAEALVPSEWSGWLDWPKEQMRGFQSAATTR
ncbi:sterol uptake control protein 2 [Stagonosporopsis vannaccii]|nr:sterol uptake control protein 2 [Stagonosporopsis vannaccii]